MWNEEEASMRLQFQQKQALTEQTLIDRKVLADNNIIRINKENSQKMKEIESGWQGQAAKWLAIATRKVTCCCALFMCLTVSFFSVRTTVLLFQDFKAAQFTGATAKWRARTHEIT